MLEQHKRNLIFKGIDCIYSSLKVFRYVVFPALVNITPVDAYMRIYCYCMNLRVSLYLHVHMIIYTVKVHSSKLYR